MKYFVVLLSFICSFNYAIGIPADAKRAIKQLPDRALTLDLIVARSMLASDSFKQLDSQKFRVHNLLYKEKEKLDVVLDAEISLNKNKNELSPSLSFLPQDTDTTSYTVGATKYFSTGTGVRAEIKTTNTDYSSSDYWESTGTLSVEQDILKNYLGSSSRRAISAGELEASASRFALEDEIENWILNLTEIFYNSWFAQRQAEAARETLANNNNLVRITKIKLKRGTAEKPDLYQVEGAQTQAERQLANANQQLTRLWVELVLSLKLPRAWVKIDPIHIPVKLDKPAKAASALCEISKIDQDFENSPSYKRYQHMSKAARLRKLSVSTLHLPDVKLFGALVANGIDNTRSETISETFGSDHPQWTFGIKASYPLGFHKSKQKIADAFASQMQSEAEASSQLSDLQNDLYISCQELKQNARLLDKLSSNVNKQKQRVRLETKRFRQGRSSPLQVLQAQTDSNQAQLSLHELEKNNRLHAWRVQKLHRKYPDYIKQIIAKYKDLTFNF